MILFISGLTGVGKSSTLKTLSSQGEYQLLPNRRDLTDQIVIPEILRDRQQEIKPVKDRLERFRITAEYRAKYPKGIIQALKSHLATLGDGSYIFDNIRGLDECKATVSEFPDGRVIFLDAPPMVRLKRLIGRNDSFDKVNRPIRSTNLLEQLQAIAHIDQVFELGEIVSLKTPTLEDDTILDAVHIILAEQKNYNASEASIYLKEVMEPHQLLYLDTSQLSLEQVSQTIKEWL